MVSTVVAYDLSAANSGEVWLATRARSSRLAGRHRPVPNPPLQKPSHRKRPASLDPAQVQQMVQSFGTLRRTVEQMAAGQDELKRDIVQMHSALIDFLAKVPEPPRQPPAAAGRKPVPAPPPSSSRPPIPPQQ